MYVFIVITQYIIKEMINKYYEIYKTTKNVIQKDKNRGTLVYCVI